MRRVLFSRRYDGVPARLAELEKDARAFSRSRAWRGDIFWLATENTTDLFTMEYFRHARNEEGLNLSAAGFLRLLGDETDAIATLYFMNDVSQRFHGRAVLRDEENPIAQRSRPDKPGMWGFSLRGIRDFAPSFLEAEAEAMRIYRGFRRLNP